MIFALTLLVICSNLFAQPALRAEADSLFLAGDYERVELVVLRAAHQPDLPDSHRVALELLGGYALIMLDKEEEARAHFRRALEVDSALVLDPVQISPKFRTVFDDVKREWLTQRIQTVATTRIREVTTWQTARSTSHLLNAALPGAGFLHERKHVRALVHFAAQSTLTILWLNELGKNNSARKDYLAADSSDAAERLYKTYDKHHQKMWTYGLAAAGVYLLSQVDLALWRTPKTSFEVLPSESASLLQFNF